MSVKPWKNVTEKKMDNKNRQSGQSEPTKAPLKKPKRRKKRRKRRWMLRKFSETKLGYFIMHEAPLEYGLILEASGNCIPNVDFIEALSYSSMNPLFRKPKFRRALIEYRKNGCHIENPRRAPASTELRYIKMRKRLNLL